MQRIHHLLELADSTVWVVWIGGIATLWHIIVYRVVAPVILIVTETCLIDRAIVIAGQDMDSVDT
jgi:hypothetical protein